LTGERTTPRAAAFASAPLVGRWMELSRLDLAYQSARIGRTEVVLIAGEPGIGKSRLLTEFVGLATSAEEGVRAADAPRVMRWAFSRVNQRSYAGFIEPLLVELGINPAGPTASEQLGPKLRELGFAMTDATIQTLAQFLHLPGATEPASDSEEWKRSMFIGVYDVLATLARQRPLLYVLEDLHFSDSASLDLLWFLASRASRVPILFLLAQRAGPGTPDPRPTRTNVPPPVPEPLNDEEAARIVESTLEWVPAELRERIGADLVLEGAPGERREGRYRFKHAVVQEVAYNTLLVRRRIELHRRVAAAFETVMGEGVKDFLPALAHHFLLGDVPEKAADYSWRAAERATAIHAYVEALRFAEQALELYEKQDRPDDAVKALYLIARVRRYRGENDAALLAYERALTILEGRDPRSKDVATVLAHIAELCTRWDAKHPDLDAIIERGLAIVGNERSRLRVLL